MVIIALYLAIFAGVVSVAYIGYASSFPGLRRGIIPAGAQFAAEAGFLAVMWQEWGGISNPDKTMAMVWAGNLFMPLIAIGVIGVLIRTNRQHPRAWVPLVALLGMAILWFGSQAARWTLPPQRLGYVGFHLVALVLGQLLDWARSQVNWR